MSKDNRYVVKMEMYVYAENDYMAKKRANDLKLSIENRRHSDCIEIVEMGEQPFASFEYRRIDDHTFYPKSLVDEPLPF